MVNRSVFGFSVFVSMYVHVINTLAVSVFFLF